MKERERERDRDTLYFDNPFHLFPVPVFGRSECVGALL